MEYDDKFDKTSGEDEKGKLRMLQRDILSAVGQYSKIYSSTQRFQSWIIQQPRGIKAPKSI
jgi:hypothetical protein